MYATPTGNVEICLYPQVATSRQYGFALPEDRGSILGFLKNIIHCCRMSTPSSTPTLPGEQREKVKNSATEVENNFFELQLEEVDESDYGLGVSGR